jgi:hypothetical protein
LEYFISKTLQFFPDCTRRRTSLAQNRMPGLLLCSEALKSARATAALRANKGVNIELYKDSTSRRAEFFSVQMYCDDLNEDILTITKNYVSIFKIYFADSSSSIQFLLINPSAAGFEKSGTSLPGVPGRAV